MRQHQVVFANFICKFGNKNLVDYLNQIVLRAFTEDTLRRPSHGSLYHLLDVELIESLSGKEFDPAIVGRFVKNTYVSRQQILDPELGLVKDEQFLKSSPSAFFVLLLKDHRLIYYAETNVAPELGTFQSTMQKFLQIKYLDYIDYIYKSQPKKDKKITKKSLYEMIKGPTLEVVPITGESELAEFVSKFSLLQKIDITVHRKNDEPAARGLIANAEAFNELVEGQKTKITTTDKEGLNKDKVVEALQKVSDGANETIRLSGKDLIGDELAGENDSFSVRSIMEHLPSVFKARAIALYNKFIDLVQSKVISRPEENKATIEKINAAIAGENE